MQISHVLPLLCSIALAATTAHAKLNVVASTPDLGALASAIGSNHIELTVLAKPTEDPHFVDAKPSFKVKLMRADVLIEGGADLETGWIPPLVDDSRNNKIQSGQPGRVIAAEGISLLEIPATLDRSKGDIHAAGNPHFMSDPANGRIVAAHICEVFCKLDAGSAGFYKANLKTFTDLLDAKMKEWKATMTPLQGSSVVSYHDSWPYFAKEFGLKMDLFLEPKPGIPPTPAHLAQVIAEMKEKKIRVIIVQAYQNRKIAETVAGHTGAAALDFPLFPGYNQSYIDWIDSLVKSLSSTLNK